MELVAPTVHRGLAYVAALNREGYLPTCDQVEAFSTSPGPKPAVYGGSIVTLATLVDAVINQQNLIEKAEPVVEYLFRMEWVSRVDRGIRLTDCGVALLRSLGKAEAEENIDSIEVTLDPKDPLVYAKLTRLIGGAGEALLVDAYFKHDHVPWLIEATQVERLLVSSRHEQATKDQQMLGLALGGRRTPERR